MTDRTNPFPNSVSETDLIGSNKPFIQTHPREIPFITEDLLLSTHKKTGLSVWEIEYILQEMIRLQVEIITEGHPSYTPLGQLGIVIIPEFGQFHPDTGIRHVLFPRRRLLPFVYCKKAVEWGYEHIPSGRMCRWLRRCLKNPRRASKTEVANETGIFGYYYFEGLGRDRWGEGSPSGLSEKDPHRGE